MTAEPEADLLARLFAEIAAKTADIAGVSRPAFSSIETEALQWLAAEANAAGLVARYDAGQNLVVTLPEDGGGRPATLIGSHVDSVPQGGNYDGLAGVLAGFAALVRARRRGRGFAGPVRLVALRGEESSWFGPCYIGSKALLGQLAADEAAAPHKGDGRPLIVHMAEAGVDVEKVRRGEPLADPSAIRRYLELHIEQGPVLEERRVAAAVVSGIRGNLRHKRVAVIGEAGHSGAVPGAYRHDPVLAAAALLAELDAHWQRLLAREQDIAVTVGVIGTDPRTSALSRIPDRVEFGLDLRSSSEAVLADMRHWLAEAAARIGEERGVRFQFDAEITTPPAHCDEDVVAGLCRAQQRLGQKPVVMPSGGGHDAAVFANAGIPTGMVFVRNRNGSHNPAEAMAIADLVAGIDILCAYLDDPESMA